MKRKGGYGLGLLFLLLLLSVIPVTAQAKAKTTGWVTKKDCVYYYNEKGKKVTGLKEIDGKSYYFDAKGVQRTGWQKIKKDYYFFRIKNGKKGFMVTSEKINRVSLKKNGKAKQTKASLAKLDVLIKANKIVEKATKPTMTKSEKLDICFTYCVKKFRYRGSQKFHKWSNWEQRYALDMFDRGYGTCFAYAASFAFLANAVGYDSVYAISSGGHGWAEVKGKIFDPSRALGHRRDYYYNVPYSLSGKGGRPNYRKNRLYVKAI